MKPKTVKILLVTSLLVVLAVIVGLQVRRLTKPRDFNIRGVTLTSIDPATRSGSVEFVHPKSGRSMKVSAERIPTDCEITINGQPADVSALRRGDQASIEGTYYPGQGSAVPTAIHVHRPEAGTTTAPASQPADGAAPVEASSHAAK